MSAANPTERPEERDSLTDAERLRVDVLNTPASKRERELGAALERLINEAKELREENAELERELAESRRAHEETYLRGIAWRDQKEQMEEALRAFVKAYPDVADRHVLAAARAALSPSDTEEEA